MPHRQGVIFSGCPEFAEQITIDNTSNTSSVLQDRQYYLMTASEDCYFLFGDSTVTVTTATGHFLQAGKQFYFHADSEIGLYIANIRDSSDGNLSISRIRD